MKSRPLSRHFYRLTYALMIGLGSVGMLLSVVRNPVTPGTSLVLWTAISFGLLSAAYLRDDSGVFGKRSAGWRRRVRIAVMLPFLIMVQGVWRLQNLIDRGDLWNRVTPDLAFGRRCRVEELPEGVTILVDVTAEFPRLRRLPSEMTSFVLPTLDGCPPEADGLHAILDAILRHPAPSVYIFCANGVGRSATFAAALLGAWRLARTPQEALALLKATRPRSGPNGDQIAFLQEWFAEKQGSLHDQQ